MSYTDLAPVIPGASGRERAGGGHSRFGRCRGGCISPPARV